MEKMKIGKLFNKKMVGNQFIKDIKERGYVAFTIPLSTDTLNVILENLYAPVVIDLRNDGALPDEKNI